MRFSTTVLAGLFTTVLASASEYQIEQRFECLAGCAMEAGLRTWFQYDQGQANPSILESIEMFCAPDSPLSTTFVKQSTVCLARNCNITLAELPAIPEAVCGLFSELMNVEEPQNAMNSAFTTMFTPVQTPIVTVASAVISVAETQAPKPTEASCVNGTYQCVDSGKSVEFTVCNNGKLVTEACAPGTVCKTVKDSILCDWA